MGWFTRSPKWAMRSERRARKNRETTRSDSLTIAANWFSRALEARTLLSVAMTAPANLSVSNNNEPTLSATVAGGLSSLQFQYSSNGGATWTNAGSAETVAPFSYSFTTALADGAYEAEAVLTVIGGGERPPRRFLLRSTPCPPASRSPSRPMAPTSNQR